MPPPQSAPSEAGHIWLVTGPASCGKTTVATHLSESLGLPYLEGDNFHPQTNIDKMSNGQPLNDEDRWDWLIVLRQQALASLAAHATNSELPPPTHHLHSDPSHAPVSTSQPGVIVTCSALKQKYRDVLRIASYNASNVHVHFIYLKISEEVSTQRALARKNHYMKANMVHSQFLALEEPTEDEWDVITVDTMKTQAEVMESALTNVKHALEKKVAEVHGA